MGTITGLELLHTLVKEQLNSKEDCLVTIYHCLMINEGNKCVGIGDEWEENAEQSASELLPDNWNLNNMIYTLRYISTVSRNRYLMKIVKAGNNLLINILNVNTDKVCSLSVNIVDHISDNFKDYSQAYKNLDKLEKTFREEVCETGGRKREADSSSSSKTDSHRNLEDANPLMDYRVPRHSSADEYYGGSTAPSIGRGDLSPFADGRGGGMLADPSNLGVPSRPTLPQFGIGVPGGLPRGAVPPGARFDPFGPPVPGRGPQFQPDPDHFQPPGFGDSFI